jgi:hypothetical protein
MHLLRFIDDAFLGQASLPLPEIIRESLQRTIVLAQQDISSNTASVHRARDEDPLSVCALSISAAEQLAHSTLPLVRRIS